MDAHTRHTLRQTARCEWRQAQEAFEERIAALASKPCCCCDCCDSPAEITVEISPVVTYGDDQQFQQSLAERDALQGADYAQLAPVEPRLSTISRAECDALRDAELGDPLDPARGLFNAGLLLTCALWFGWLAWRAWR